MIVMARNGGGRSTMPKKRKKKMPNGRPSGRPFSATFAYTPRRRG